MKFVKKRDGRVVNFNPEKIIDAVLSAYKEVDGGVVDQHAADKATNIAKYIQEAYEKENKSIFSVEEIQDLVEKGLMSGKRKDVARAYIVYREERTKVRGNSLDEVIQEIVSGESEYWNTENSNKNAKIVTTQRDYLAGALSTDLTRRKLLPKDIVEAHDSGIIHFHDADYFAQNALNNCCLINLEDMLQNGTCINGVMIDKPHKFLTAMTIATQIILGVSSSQYGGCTVSMSHLAPFVRDSYNSYIKKYKELGIENDVERLAKYDILKEIEAGVQTFNYQVNSMTNTNG